MLQGEDLGDIQHRTAADGDDSGDVLGHISNDCLHHLVGRLTQTVFFLEQHGAGQVQRAKVRVI